MDSPGGHLLRGHVRSVAMNRNGCQKEDPDQAVSTLTSTTTGSMRVSRTDFRSVVKRSMKERGTSVGHGRAPAGPQYGHQGATLFRSQGSGPPDDAQFDSHR